MGQVTLATEEVRVVVDPSYGGGVVRLGRPDGPNLLSERSWAPPLPANRSLSYGDDALDFLSDFRGGWHVLFPNTGDACTVGGVPLPFHGELARARWQVVASTETRLELRCPSRLPVR